MAQQLAMIIRIHLLRYRLNENAVRIYCGRRVETKDV